MMRGTRLISVLAILFCLTPTPASAWRFWNRQQTVSTHSGGAKPARALEAPAKPRPRGVFMSTVLAVTLSAMLGLPALSQAEMASRATTTERAAVASVTAPAAVNRGQVIPGMFNVKTAKPASPAGTTVERVREGGPSAVTPAPGRGDRKLTPGDRKLTPGDRKLTPRDRKLTPRDRTHTPRGRVVVPDRRHPRERMPVVEGGVEGRQRIVWTQPPPVEVVVTERASPPTVVVAKKKTPPPVVKEDKGASVKVVDEKGRSVSLTPINE